MPDPSGRPAPVTLHVAREQIGFAAAHFGIIGGERERLHGHNYRVSLRASGPVDADGTVVDFAALKEALRAECAALDHRMLVPTECPSIAVRAAGGRVGLRVGADEFSFPAADVRLLALRNTTCECLAGHLLDHLRERLDGLGVSLEVTVEESPGQGATVAGPRAAEAP